MFTHIRECTAGADGVIVAHPALVVWVFPSGQHILVAGVVGLLIQHPAATVHFDGVAAAEVRVHVRAVCVALIGAALEVPVLIKCDLILGEKMEAGRDEAHSILIHSIYNIVAVSYQKKPTVISVAESLTSYN